MVVCLLIMFLAETLNLDSSRYDFTPVFTYYLKLKKIHLLRLLH
jgi:hypothetical protein